MVQCEKCGALCGTTYPTNKERTKFLCKECYKKEGNALLVWYILKLVVGLAIGGYVLGQIFSLLTTNKNIPDALAIGGGIASGIMLIVGHIASRIFKKRVHNTFLRFLLGVISYVTFWTALVFLALAGIIVYVAVTEA